MQEEPKNYWQQDQADELITPEPQPQPVQYAPQGAPATPAPAQNPIRAQPVEQPTQEPAEAALPVVEPITWSAEEYVHPDKGPLWYVILSLVALALIAIDIFFLKSWTFSALVVVMFIALIVYIRRPARTLTYAISPSQGLYVGETLHPFEEFKSFGIIQDGIHNSIMLIPRKRFAMGVSVFFPQEAGEVIVDILGQRLPMENLKLDVVDTIVRKLRL